MTTNENTPAVTVYSTPNCVQCKHTMRKLDQRGIPYRTHDLAADPQPLDELRSLGHQKAPVVVAGDQHWSGYRPDLIDTLAAA